MVFQHAKPVNQKRVNGEWKYQYQTDKKGYKNSFDPVTYEFFFTNSMIQKTAEITGNKKEQWHPERMHSRIQIIKDPVRITRIMRPGREWMHFICNGCMK